MVDDVAWRVAIETEIALLKEGYKAIPQMRDLMSEMNSKLGILLLRVDTTAKHTENVEQGTKNLMTHEQKIEQLFDWVCGTGSHDPGLKNRVTSLEQASAKELGERLAYGSVGIALGGLISFVATNHQWLFGR